jgi:hypothetical protein
MVPPHSRPTPLRPAPPPPLRQLLAGTLLLPLLAACERKAMDNVPTMGVENCKVQLGDKRENVLLRCGPGCGGGDTPTGRCDVYHHVLICYGTGADQRVQSLRQLGPHGDQFAWCRWNPPAEAPAPRAPAPAAPGPTTP